MVCNNIVILSKVDIKTHNNTYINTHPGLSHDAGGAAAVAAAAVTDVVVYRRCGCFCIPTVQKRLLSSL